MKKYTASQLSVLAILAGAVLNIAAGPAGAHH